ncbi:hypothetical protein F7725_013133 [Dissostichus mawsoni]|uniref:Serine/threonine-protein phosphatase with EF-hands n=1 Tax=Dissostichus mawsoni TaxID=36200 RepID=A0A7J5YR17_DISMA|nr:hypothetical protein F7725_013133 [Dissostichus mawsoni]
MGCGVSKSNQFHKNSGKAIKSAVLIQRWYRQFVARKEMRRRYTWHIFQSIEYSGEQAQIKLYNFLGYLMDNFTPASNERNLISHIFRENEVCRDAEWERYFCYKNIEVPDLYSGPHLTFPLTVEQAVGLVEAFRNKKQLHSRYVLQLLLETWKQLRLLPNINRISTCHSKEITICDRGKDSIEILIILFSFLLVYPSEVYLNRGNHEDHIVNLRYGFTKEVLSKYRMHGKRILKLLQKIFSWLPLATVIDQKVLVIHGGISNTTDLSVLARVDRHNYNSALRPPKKRHQSVAGVSIDSDMDEEGGVHNKVFQRRPSLKFPRTLTKDCFQNRSLQDFSDRLRVNTVEDVERLPGPLGPENDTSQSCESISSEDEWKQILDLLWSDPMAQDGCVPNEVRGGGCYWGPDVTEDFLNRHNLQLIIRSHECKQEGYEFCHNRPHTVLRFKLLRCGKQQGGLREVGSRPCALLVQYQASSMIRELSVRQSAGRSERSANKVLREQLFAHKSDLICAFKKLDSENKGRVSLADWASAVESVMRLGLPWRIMRSQLVTGRPADSSIDYYEWFNELAIKGANADHIDQSLLETLYRHRSTLETIFRIVDTDNSGFITMEDFRQTWKLLSVYLKMEITEEAISDLAVSIDSNQDGSIDIEEFMEAFRLTDKKSDWSEDAACSWGRPTTSPSWRETPTSEQRETLKTDLSSDSSPGRRGRETGEIKPSCFYDAH